MITVTHALVKGGHWTGSSVFYITIRESIEPGNTEDMIKTLSEYPTKQPVGLYFRVTDYEHIKQVDTVVDAIRERWSNVQIILEVWMSDATHPVWDKVNWIIARGTVSDSIPAGVNEVQLGWAVGDGPIEYIPRSLWGKTLVYVYPMERHTMNRLFEWMSEQVVPMKLIPYGLVS